MNKGGTNLMYNRGDEGPSHDPYSYEEFTVFRNGSRVTLHLGLIEWLEVDGYKYDGCRFDESYTIQEMFEDETGMNVTQFMKYYETIHNTCKKCGCRDNYSMSGFPGEILNICCKCGEVVSSDMNWGAIM